jgi:hypothetical protein
MYISPCDGRITPNLITKLKTDLGDFKAGRSGRLLHYLPINYVHIFWCVNTLYMSELCKFLLFSFLFDSVCVYFRFILGNGVYFHRAIQVP